MACLSSRIPYGSDVTPAKLKQIEEAEAFLRTELGLTQVRVRHHEKVARIEVLVEELARLVENDTRQKVLRKIKDLGFNYVALDLAGFRSGSLNEVLNGSI